MIVSKNKYHSLTNKAFAADYINNLSAQILASPHLGVSQLSDSFAETKGFSIVFNRAGIKQVESNFPFFKLYLKAALKPSCNAFYLNPLILESGGVVKPHVDCSISEYCKTFTTAQIVSILYVKVPSDLEGGELILGDRDRQISKITPKTNTLLHFKGNLTHSVNRVKSKNIRISLVCEQYTLSENKLKLVPEFALECNRY